MSKVTGELSVYFDGQFWVGVFERCQNGTLSAAKVTFGAEPRNFEVLKFVCENYFKLKFSPAVEGIPKAEHKNPKRVRREIQRELQNVPRCTKSQAAMKLQQEQAKTERRQVTREEREAEKQRIRELKRQKKIEKHRGR